MDSYSTENNWNFPSGRGLTLTGINLPGIDTFSDVPINSMTREGIQNSLDAKDSNVDGPVIVKFRKSAIKSNLLPGLEKLQNIVIPGMRKKWSDNETAHEFLKNYENLLQKETIDVLTMSDYNTKGLAAKNWQSLIFVAGDSVKDDEASAGSKGIGKFAPFAASNFRMVFYHTISEVEGERSIGVSQLMSFDTNNDEVTQGPGYYTPGYDSNQHQYREMIGDYQFDTERTNEYGTDVSIIGFKNEHDWQDRIKMSVLSNFLISIWEKQLEVYVGDEVINKDTLSDVFLYFKKMEVKKNSIKITDDFKDSERAFNVLISSTTKTIDLPKAFVDKYEFIESEKDAYLKLALLEETNRKVLQTRKSGMKINYKNRINGSINFFGIFHATGRNLNKFLKDIENANHDDWYPDRISDNDKKKTAEYLLKDLTRFYKNSVKDNFSQDLSDEMEIFGLSDTLTINSTKQDVNPANIDKKISNINIRTNKTNIKSYPTQNKKEQEILETLYSHEEEAVEEGKQIRGSERRNPQNGNKKEAKSSQNYATRGAEIDNVRVKFIEINALKGIYRINIISNKKREAIELELHAIGENASNTKLFISSSDLLNSEITDNGSLLIKKISARTNISGFINIKFDSRVRLEGKVYEIRK